MRPYDIPLRALIARDVDGLMMAGRCISGDFVAHASYRVTGNAVAMGEKGGKTTLGIEVLPKKLDEEVARHMVAGFGGVLLVIRPGSHAFHPAILLSVINALLYAAFNLLTRRMAATESPAASFLLAWYS